MESSGSIPKVVKLKYTEGQGEIKPRTKKSNIFGPTQVLFFFQRAKQGKTLWIFLLISYAVTI